MRAVNKFQTVFADEVVHVVILFISINDKLRLTRFHPIVGYCQVSKLLTGVVWKQSLKRHELKET